MPLSLFALAYAGNFSLFNSLGNYAMEYVNCLADYLFH